MSFKYKEYFIEDDVQPSSISLQRSSLHTDFSLYFDGSEPFKIKKRKHRASVPKVCLSYNGIFIKILTYDAYKIS